MPVLVMENQSVEDVIAPEASAEPVIVYTGEDDDQNVSDDVRNDIEEEQDDIWQDRIDKDETYRRELSLLFKELRSQAISNVEYYHRGRGAAEIRFFRSFQNLYEHLDSGIEPGVEALLKVCHRYDVDPDTPANGYRSMVQTIHKCCVHIKQLTRHISTNRAAFTFRANHYSKELEAYVTTLGQLRACLYYLQQLIDFYSEGQLFSVELREEDRDFAMRMMLEFEALSQEPFYGRCLGFHCCDSIIKTLTTINTVMASFADGYFETDSSSTIMRLAKTVVSGSRYFMNPELRAEKVVQVTRTCDIDFCKAFWSLAENSVMHTLPLFICPPVAVDDVLIIPAESIELSGVDGKQVTVEPPKAHTGPGPVNARLISYHVREGQDTDSNPGKVHPPSKGLIIHFHGGGFVAQSSASHEVYLRQWARETNTPILSIDYSLAPENPFPRQVEECFFAYCWALENCHELGSTAEVICLTGDSAGGNVAMLTALEAIEHGVRKPDAILSSYGCMLVQYVPSPSRMMSLMDPLLPMGIMSQCLSAYAGHNPHSTNEQTPPPITNKISSEPPSMSIARDIPMTSHSTQQQQLRQLSLDLSMQQPHSPPSWRRTHVRSPSSPTFPTSPLSRNGFNGSTLASSPVYAKTQYFEKSPGAKFLQTSYKANPKMSPYLAEDSLLKQMPPVYFLACKLDPMLDDSIMMARKLRALGAEVHVDALEDLPHGFLNFVLVSQDAWNGNEVCMSRLKHIFSVSKS